MFQFGAVPPREGQTAKGWERLAFKMPHDTALQQSIERYGVQFPWADWLDDRFYGHAPIFSSSLCLPVRKTVALIAVLGKAAAFEVEYAAQIAVQASPLST